MRSRRACQESGLPFWQMELDFGYYNMDCMDGMKQFPDKYFDLAIVDPPYLRKIFAVISKSVQAYSHIAKVTFSDLSGLSHITVGGVQKRRQDRVKLIYVCSPYRAENDAILQRNIDYARELTRSAFRRRFSPSPPSVLHDRISQSTSRIFNENPVFLCMKIGLIDVDGHNFPNIPLMKISAWHKKQGDSVEWYDPMIASVTYAKSRCLPQSRSFSSFPV